MNPNSLGLEGQGFLTGFLHDAGASLQGPRQNKAGLLSATSTSKAL